MTTMEKVNRNAVDWGKFNEGQPIKYLISAPTMRVPWDISETANAYLAFRGIILAGRLKLPFHSQINNFLKNIF